MASKTLVCIIAETRAYRITWPSFKMRVLDPLRADLLLCISVPADYDFSNPFWQFAKFRCATPEFSDWGDAFDEAQRLELEEFDDTDPPNWRKLLDIKDQWLGGIKGPSQHPGSAAILIYYRWCLLKYIKSECLLERYDRFIVTRSDFVWKSPHPPVSCLNPDKIWVPDGEGYGGVTDRHAVLSRENIFPYLNIINPLIKEPEAVFLEMKGKINWNLEQFISFSIARAGLKEKIRFFPYVMYAAREWNGSTSWTMGQWSDDLGYYIKYLSEFQSASSAEFILESSDHWSRFFQKCSCVGFNSRVSDQQGNVFVLEGDKLVGRHSSSISNDSLTLSIDYSHRRGFLYLTRHRLGSCGKQLFDEVEVTQETPFTYSILSLKDNLYYFVDRYAGLGKSIEKRQDFMFEGKYLLS